MSTLLHCVDGTIFRIFIVPTPNWPIGLFFFFLVKIPFRKTRTLFSKLIFTFTFFEKEKNSDDKTIHSWITFRKQRIVLLYCYVFWSCYKKVKDPKLIYECYPKTTWIFCCLKLCLLLWQKTFLWATHFQGLFSFCLKKGFFRRTILSENVVFLSLLK